MLLLTAALDPASQVPLYEQLYRSIAREISAGALPAGAAAEIGTGEGQGCFNHGSSSF